MSRPHSNRVGAKGRVPIRAWPRPLRACACMHFPGGGTQRGGAQAVLKALNWPCVARLHPPLMLTLVPVFSCWACPERTPGCGLQSRSWLQLVGVVTTSTDESPALCWRLFWVTQYRTTVHSPCREDAGVEGANSRHTKGLRHSSQGLGYRMVALRGDN